MLQFVALFFPGLLSMQTFDVLSQDTPKFSKTSWLQRYASYTLLDVVCAILLLKLLRSDAAVCSGGNLTDAYLGSIYFAFVSAFAIFWGYVSKVASAFLRLKVVIAEDSEAAEENQV